MGGNGAAEAAIQRRGRDRHRRRRRHWACDRRGARRARRDHGVGRTHAGQARGGESGARKGRRQVRGLRRRRVERGGRRAAAGLRQADVGAGEGGGQQCRRQLHLAHRRAFDAEVARADRGRPRQHLLHVPRLHPAAARNEEPVDPQRGLDLRPHRQLAHAGLLRGQGRRRLADAAACRRLWGEGLARELAVSRTHAVAARQRVFRQR